MQRLSIRMAMLQSSAFVCKCVHRFPHSQPELLRQWVHNMHREGFVPSKKSVVCSDHFEASCFDRTGQTVRLRAGAVPTLFSLPDHLIKVSAVKSCEVFAKTSSRVVNNLK